MEEEEESPTSTLQFDEEDDDDQFSPNNNNNIGTATTATEDENITSNNSRSSSLFQETTEVAEVEIDEEEDFLLNGDIMDTPSVASAFSDESEVNGNHENDGKHDFSLDYLTSLRYILEKETQLKKKKQVIGKVHKIIWKRYHEPNYPQYLSASTGGENQNHFIHLIMSEVATDEDIIRVTEQFGPILYGLEISDCFQRKSKKNPPPPPKKKRKTKKEENVDEQTVVDAEKEDFSHPVLNCIVKNCQKLEILRLDGNYFTVEQVQHSNVLSLPNLKTYFGPFAEPLEKSKTYSGRLRKVKIETDRLSPTLFKFLSKNSSSNNFRTLLTNPETSISMKTLEDLAQLCDQVTKISLKHVKFVASKDKLCNVLKSFENLKCLKLFNENSVDSNDFKRFNHLVSLTELNVTRCDNLDDTALSSILKKCQSIKKLVLDNCWQVSEVSLKDLSNLNDLQYLDLTGLRVTNKTLKILAENISSSDNFTHFICESNYNATDDGLQVLLEKFPSLQCLNLNRWEKLTDVSLENIGKYLKSPKKLGLAQGFKSKARYTCEGLKKALAPSKSVECLTLQSVDDINQAMAVLSENAPLLKELSVSGNEKLNDDAVEVLCEGCKYLKVIDFGQCSLLSDEALNAVSNLKNLREINIADCEEVTSDGIEILLDACSYLFRVHIKPDFTYIEKTKQLFLEHTIRFEKEVVIQIR